MSVILCDNSSLHPDSCTHDIVKAWLKQRDDREEQLRLIQGAPRLCTSIQQALIDPSFATKQQMLQ